MRIPETLKMRRTMDSILCVEYGIGVDGIDVIA